MFGAHILCSNSAKFMGMIMAVGKANGCCGGKLVQLSARWLFDVCGGHLLQKQVGLIRVPFCSHFWGPFGSQKWQFGASEAIKGDTIGSHLSHVKASHS